VTRTGGFELRGTDSDETRLLVHEGVGYSMAIPGRPGVVTPSHALPRYDVVLQLADAPIEIGLRIDRLGKTAIEPAAMLASLTTSYVQSRAASPSEESISPMGRRGLAPGASAGLRATYPLRGDDAAAMEFLAVLLRDDNALHLTVRFRKGETTPFAWGNLRAILLNSQSWTPGTLASTDVWPRETRFVKPTVAFELSESAVAEARAKANDLGEVTPDEVNAIADVLLDVAKSDEPATLPWLPLLNQHAASRVAMAVPPRIAEVLVRDIDAVQSMVDYRGWAWECFWAVGNRSSLRDRTTS
jgi:hypothetical protein